MIIFISRDTAASRERSLRSTKLTVCYNRHHTNRVFVHRHNIIRYTRWPLYNRIGSPPPVGLVLGVIMSHWNVLLLSWRISVYFLIFSSGSRLPPDFCPRFSFAVRKSIYYSRAPTSCCCFPLEFPDLYVCIIVMLVNIALIHDIDCDVHTIIINIV